jgi:hypothetical protein
MQVNGRYESVPVWEDPDSEAFFVDEDASKEKKDRWDERLVLGSGWLYKQDVTLAQLSNERKLVGDYLGVVDEVLFEGKKGARGSERGWEKEKRRLRDKERSRSSVKRRVSAGDFEGRSAARLGVGLGLGLGEPGPRRVSTGMLPDMMGQLSFSDEPQLMEGISEEGENADVLEEVDEAADEDSGLEDDLLPEWAKRSAFMDDDLGLSLTYVFLPLLISYRSRSIPAHVPSPIPAQIFPSDRTSVFITIRSRGVS